MQIARFIRPMGATATAALCAVTLWTTGCASSAGAAGGTSPAASTATAGAKPSGPALPADGPSLKRWSDQAWEVASLGSRDLPEGGPRPTLQVMESAAVGTDGCNRYRHPFTVPADVPGALRFSPEGAVMTRMACLPPADAIAREWHQALTATRSIRAEGHRLLLIDQSDNVLARLRPQTKTAGTP